MRKNPIFLLTRRFIHGIIQITYKAYRFVLAINLRVLIKRRCKAYVHCIRQLTAAEFPLWTNVRLPGRTGLVRGAQRFALPVKRRWTVFSARELYLIASGHFYLPGCRVGPLWERVEERAYDLVAVKENVSPSGPSGHLPRRGRLSQHETIITNKK